MANSELDTIFRANMQEFPRTVVGWTTLPSPFGEAVQRAYLSYLFFGFTNATTRFLPEGSHFPVRPRTEAFIENFMIETEAMMANGRYAGVIFLASGDIDIAPEFFLPDQKDLVREILYQQRGLASINLSPVSAATDLLRADIIAGVATGRAQVAAGALESVGMTMLPSMIMDKLAGR